MQRFRNRKVLGAALLVAVVAVPLVAAATGTFGGALERQSARWTTTNVSTSSTDWRDVPGLRLVRCTDDQVTAMLSATVSGAPVRFRVVIDAVEEAPLQPGSARFAPDGVESFSYTFVGNTAAFEANDNHSFTVQWRSTDGQPVTLESGALNLLFQRGDQAC